MNINLENNIKIAEFVSRRGKENKHLFYHYDELTKKAWHTSEELLYDKSWDWLMKVVDYISDMDLSEYMYKWEYEGDIKYNFNYVDFEISTGDVWVAIDLDLDEFIKIYHNNLFKTKSDKKQAVYEAVLNYIDFYYKLTNQNG